MDKVRVLTINIWNRFGPWAERLEVLRAGLQALSADVVVLQEVLRMEQGNLSQLDEVGDGLYPYRAYAPAFTIDESSGFTLGNAVLSRWPLREQEQILLPNPMQHESRGLLYVLCELPSGQLPVFVTHLDWQFELSFARCQQVSFIVEHMEKWLGRAQKRAGTDLLPAVLAGDFNAEPDSDEIRFLRGRHALPRYGSPNVLRGVYFNDCFAYCGGDERDGATFASSNTFAATQCEPDRRIDYIFTGPPDRLRRGQPLRAWRCLDTPHPQDEKIFASDHYGVAADIRVAPLQKTRA